MRSVILPTILFGMCLLPSSAILGQNPDMFLNVDNMWVAGRDAGNPRNGFIAIVLKIEDDPDEAQPKYVRARMWGYQRRAGSKYSGMEKLTPGAVEGQDDYLKGEVSQIGSGKNRRQSLTLARPDGKVTVWLTSMVQRSKKRTGQVSQEIVLCRWKDLRKGQGKEKIECEEPPTEDVLEEESGINPEMEDPALDPTYYP